MYLLPGILVFIFLLVLLGGCRRRKKIIKKVCCMCLKEKCEILDNLLMPFGYEYVPSQDIFTSRIDAWQRKFGYSAFYDKAASHFGMVIDSLPVYFNYDGRTWLIELWKGQYGINTGCEIGVYYAERILNENELDYTLFNSVNDEDMPELSLVFYNSVKNKELAQLSKPHWWLTAFKPGLFTPASNLSLWASITLHSPQMAKAFSNALINTGFHPCDICVHRNTVTFTFEGFTHVCCIFSKLRIAAAMRFNRLLCRIFLFATRPFKRSADRVLYLYYYIPFVFRRIFNVRKCKNCKR